MAGRTPIPVNHLSRFVAFSAASPASVTADTIDGNLTDNDGYTFLEMTNTSGAARTVTVTIPGGVDVNLTAPNRTYSLPNNGVHLTGVFPVDVYGAQLLYTASGSGVSFRPISLRGGV